MATLQKEKQKKKRKPKETSIESPTEEYLENTNKPLNISDNFVQKENTESIQQEKRQDISSFSKSACEIDKSLVKECVVENLTVKTPDSTNSLTLPSAPVVEKNCNNKIHTLENVATINYPDLAKLQISSNKIAENSSMFQSVHEVITSPNPMTKMQLAQLYDCKMLDVVRQFEVEFLSTSLQQNFDNDPLYTFLQQYALARSKIKVNLMDLEDLRFQFETSKNYVWRENIVTARGSNTCHDNVQVYAKKNYVTFEVNQPKLQNLTTALSKTCELVCFSYKKNKLNAEAARMKVEQIIREILSHPCFSTIDSNSNIQTSVKPDSLTLQGLSHLRRALSILFNCLRKPAPDKVFTDDLIKWICTLVAAYLRIATIQDHWFLLFHILRCPSGVSTWATNFIQISEPKLPIKCDLMDCIQINHCLSILHILLLPIKKRNEFLNALSKSHKEISDPVKDDVWILIDSDGEEGSNLRGECTGLKEIDLISFLNQIPLEMIFRCAINAKENDNDYNIDNDRITEHQFLKLIAFNAKLVDLFGDGLLTYNIERYKQFAKRLGRLIRHTIHYISDIHEVFLRNKLSKDPYLCEQITVEMNSFIIKSCSYIYKTPNLATWQYFSSLPFALLESDTLWQLFLYLNIGFPDEFPVPNEDFKKTLNEPNFWIRFNKAVSDLSSEDLYYLIQTFFEMANERDRIKDWDFIETACLHIFLIGFVNESTREICYKTSRDMLTNLTLSYPDLIASLLRQMKICFKETDNLIYLVKSLPLENWKTDIQSFEILSIWLLNYNYDCKENALARVIISHLNWSFDMNKRLFLPHNIHVRMACLICEALNKHNPENIGSSTISESMRQVSNLIENHCNKEQFTTWCWNMISLLRLHLMDQNSEAIQKTLQNPSDHLCFVPELENFNIIYQGVTENRPLTVYISLLISLWGHSIPLICQKGIPQMKLLLLDHRYTCVIRCIQLITPLFLESPDTLANCENFQELLKIILNADRTYLKMAKDLVGSNSHGPVFEHFMNMMQSQIIHYYETGLTTPSLFIHLWLEILSSFQNWHNTNIVFLIDAILKIAYQFSDSWGNCKEFFREYYKNFNYWKSDRSSSFKLLLGTGNQNKYFPIYSTDCGWLSLLLLELEHESQERDNFLWSELLRNLVNADDKIETSLKKSCNAIGYSQFSLSSLVLYKYANLIANSDINHPLLPIFGQKFFLLFLARVNFSQEEERFHYTFAVSDKFYEYNIQLMKKMKMKLKQAEDNYCNLSQKNADNEVLYYFYTQCSKIMKTFLLWLEETDIQKISRNQRIDLPPQYNAEKLTDIMNGNEQHWTEFIYLRKIRDQQKHASNQWLKYCFRFHEIKSTRCAEILQSKNQINAIDRIKNHLKSYEKPLDPPIYNKIPLIFNPLTSNSISSQTLGELRKELKYINEFAKNVNSKYNEINALNGNFNEQIQLLYKNIPCTTEVSQECSKFTTCAGPARITLTLSRAQKMESVQRKLDENREKHENIIEELLNDEISSLVYSIQNMEHIVRCLLIAQSEIREKAHKKNIQISRVAIDFFYDILKSINENTIAIEPCNQIYLAVAHELGIFIQNNQETEGLRILDMSIKRPDLMQLLSEFFIPIRATPANFLNMYKFLIDAYIKNQEGRTISTLLSKFNILNWLEIIGHDQIQSSEITQLLKLILCGLENWNKPESSRIQDILRGHLIHLFNYEFPTYYLEILQTVLNSVSEQKICPIILLDLINSLLKKIGCDNLTLESSKYKIEEESVRFANIQNLLNFKNINDTFMVFSQHFQNERLRNGLHGLYPKHKNYCLPLSMWFTILGRTLLTSAISTYPGVLGDQICDSVFAPIISIYSPWIIVYREKDFQHSTANWIKQFIKNGKDLFPWSDEYLETAELMIDSYINNLHFILKNLPVSNTILGHIYSWYHYHFTDLDPLNGNSIIIPIQSSLQQLSWDKFSPQSNHIDCFYRTLSESIPECQNFLANIFINIQWSNWIREQFYSWDSRTQHHAINLLLPVFIEISLNPNINSNLKQAKILEDSLEFPWHIVDIKNVQEVLNWLTITVNPEILFNLNSGNRPVNGAILKLLQVSCGMSRLENINNVKYQVQTKRIFYVRNIVKMLHTCSSGNDKLLKTSEGLRAYQSVLVELLNSIENILLSESSPKEKEIEGQNLMLEIIGSLQNKNQTLSKYFIDAIVFWQSKCNADSYVLILMLNSFGLCKTFIFNMYPLLETTLYNYFRFPIRDVEVTTWINVFKRLGSVINNFDYQTLLNGPYFLSLHIYILYKIQNMCTPGEKITFLQDISQLLENLKINEMNESKLILIWGAVITCGCKMLLLTENVKKTLLMIARQFHIVAKQSEGWSDSLLGAIGLRRDTTIYKRKIFFRCLATIIFSLFPDQSGGESRQSQEFVLSLNELNNESMNKSCSNYKQKITESIEIIKEYSNLGPELVAESIFKIINIFYDDNFMKTAQEVWII